MMYNPREVFCLYSAAEAANLLPVLDYLPIKPQLLAFGTAYRHVLNSPYKEKLLPLSHFFSHIGSKGCYGESFSDQDALSFLAHSIEKCSYYLTGMGSCFQRQLLHLIKKTRSKPYCVAYYDGFSDPIKHPFAMDFVDDVDRLFVSCLCVKSVFRKKCPELSIDVVGREDLDKWERKSVLWNALDKGASRLLYSCAYGAAYKKDFLLFLDSIPLLKNWEIWISLHPSLQCTGRFEKKAIAQRGLKNLIILPKEIDTLKALSYCHTLVASRSNTPLAAWAAGRPSLYLSQHYENFATLKGCVPVARNPKSFYELLEKIFEKGDLFKEMGLLKNSAEHIALLWEKLNYPSKLGLSTATPME